MDFNIGMYQRRQAFLSLFVTKAKKVLREMLIFNYVAGNPQIFSSVISH